jgi:hypothetical protein
MEFKISMLWYNCELILYLMGFCTNVFFKGMGYNGIMWLWIELDIMKTMC